MPATGRNTLVRARVAGVWVDPKEWAHIAGEWVQVDPGTEPPVPSNALAMPPAPVNGFDTAASFYDSVGVNVHFIGSGTPYVENRAAVLAGLYELGARHIRDSIYGSWFDFRWQFGRPALVAIRNRNANLPAPSAADAGQPIFFLGFTGGWGPDNQGNPNAYINGQPNAAYNVEDVMDVMGGGHQHYNGNAGPTGPAGHISGVGSPVPGGTTVPNENATFPNPWNFATAEMPWSIIGAIGGPNEPANPTGAFPANKPAIKTWLKGLTDAKRARSTVVDNLPRVTENGIQTGVRVSQLPTYGTQLLDYGWIPSVGDCGPGTGVVDCADMHFYATGHEPSHESITQYLVNDPTIYKNANGSLPWVITEWGHISRGMSNHSFHSGYWPTPDDLIAELMVRMIVLLKLRGVRRSYIYEFWDEFNNAASAEANFGLVKHNGTRKHQFYAIRNLLRLVGFSEPAGTPVKLPVTVTGFVSSGNNDHLGMREGIGGFGQSGVGEVYHRNQDRLDQFQLQGADDYKLIVSRQIMIWDREPGNWNPATNLPQSLGNEPAGRKTPNTQNLTVHLSANVVEVYEATPTAGGITTPDDGSTWTGKTITDNTVPLQIQARTKVLRLVTS